MSGDDPTGVAAGAGAPPAISVTVASPVPVAPQATQTAPATSGDALVQTNWTRQMIALCSMVTVCVSILGAVGVMCVRVWQDGNGPLVADLTTKLSFIAIVGVGSLMTALLGSNSLIAKLMDKL